MTSTVHRIGAILGRLRPQIARVAVQVEHLVGRPTSQVAALQAISAGATSVSSVAHHCLAHMSSASRTVDALVTDGLVDRRTDPDDRRAVILALTPTGDALVARIVAHRQAFLTHALDELDDDEQATLVALLDRLVDGIQTSLDTDRAESEALTPQGSPT